MRPFVVQKFSRRDLRLISCLVLSCNAVIKGAFKTLSIIYAGIYNAWKVSVFKIFLVCIFPHSDWVRRETRYLSVFNSNAGKCRQEKLPIWTLLFLTIVLSAENYIHEKNQLQMYGKAQKATLVIFIKRTQEYSILSGQYIPAYGIWDQGRIHSPVKHLRRSDWRKCC